MRITAALTLAAGAVLSAAGFVAACTSSTNDNASGSTGDDDAATSNTDSSTMDGGAAATTDAAATAADADDGAVPLAFVRLANWSPDAPAIDVCFDPAGAAWTGVMPAVGQILSTFDGGTTVPDAGSDGGTSAPGLDFPQVTTYLVIPAGSYAVRLVPAGATDCTAGVVDLPNMAALAANTYTTIAALGEVNQVGTDSKLALVSFNDDVTAPSSQIALRFINGSPSSSLTQADLGTGSLVGNGGTFAPLFTGVAFGSAGAAVATDAGAVDVNGYLAEVPFAGATLSVHATAGAQDTTTALNDVTIARGAATVALVGGISNGIAADAAQLLLCTDVDDSTRSSLYATCDIVSTQ